MLMPILLVMAQAAAPQAAPASRPPAAATAAAQNSEAAFYAGLRQRGLSEAGARLLQASAARRSSDFQRLIAGVQSANRELTAIAAAPTLDLPKFAAGLRRRDAAVAALETLQSTALLDSLQALVPADRAVLVRFLDFVPSAAPPAQRR